MRRAQWDTVQVDWVDSIASNDWVTREEAVLRARGEGVMHSVSVGMLLDETDDYVLLIGSHMRDGDLVTGTMQIPRSSISEIHRVAIAGRWPDEETQAAPGGAALHAVDCDLGEDCACG